MHFQGHLVYRKQWLPLNVTEINAIYLDTVYTIFLVCI